MVANQMVRTIQLATIWIPHKQKFAIQVSLLFKCSLFRSPLLIKRVGANWRSIFFIQWNLQSVCNISHNYNVGNCCVGSQLMLNFIKIAPIPPCPTPNTKKLTWLNVILIHVTWLMKTVVVCRHSRLAQSQADDEALSALIQKSKNAKRSAVYSGSKK